MSTVVKPKTLRSGGIAKKMLPKTKAAAQRLERGPEPAAQTATPTAQPIELGEVVQLRCDWLRRHPANRVPAPAEVEARAQSLQEEGQLEPVIVRELRWGSEEDDFQGYEIISGETRWLAAQSLGWQTLAGRVIQDCDDRRALELLASYNGQRTDLDPMQRALLIQQLCRPVEEGGAGHTREQAAQAVGLQSASAASNLVRLLELPQVWQDRVAAGELPESFARMILPIAKAPRLLELLEAVWKIHLVEPNDDWDDFRSRDAVQATVEEMIYAESRPIEPGKKFDYPYKDFPGGYSESSKYAGEHPLLFELTDKLREDLDIVELSVRRGSKTESELRATNLKLFNKHQIPAIIAKVDGKKKKKANASADKDEQQPKQQLTAAEQKQLDKERAEKLAKRTDSWRHSWLCHMVARRIELWPEACNALIAWMITEGGWSHYEMKQAAVEALQAYQGEKLKAKSIWPYLYSVKDPMPPEDAALVAVARYALMKDAQDGKSMRFREIIDNLARRCQINDLETEWKAIQSKAADAADKLQFELFLGLHSTAQLDALGEQVGLYTGGQKGKAAKMEHFQLAPQAVLLPPSIRPLVDPTVETKKTPVKKGAARKKAAKKK